MLGDDFAIPLNPFSGKQKSLSNKAKGHKMQLAVLFPLYEGNLDPLALRLHLSAGLPMNFYIFPLTAFKYILVWEIKQYC